jgi:hypothetical protein
VLLASREKKAILAGMGRMAAMEGKAKTVSQGRTLRRLFLWMG